MNMTLIGDLAIKGREIKDDFTVKCNFGRIRDGRIESQGEQLEGLVLGDIQFLSNNRLNYLSTHFKELPFQRLYV